MLWSVLLWATPARRAVPEVKVIKFSSTSTTTLENILKPLITDGWQPITYGNGFLILKRG